MSRNPYTAPDSTPAGVHRRANPRPFSVWALLVVLGALVAIALFAIVKLAMTLVSGRGDGRGGLLVFLPWWLGQVAFFAGTGIGIFLARPWARWLGVLAIVLFAILVYSIPVAVTYKNEFSRPAAFAIRNVVLPVLTAWWAYAFGFSARSRRYFDPPAQQPRA